MAEVPDEEVSEREFASIQRRCVRVQFHFCLQLLESLQAQVDVECKIKDGAENLLNVFAQSASGFIDPSAQKNASSREQLRQQVQEELDAAEAKIAKLRQQMEIVIHRSKF